MNTKHKADCSRVFGRYDVSCPRCLELKNGSPARKGWQTQYFALKSWNDKVESVAIKAHFAPGGPHARGECGPVCTFGD